MPEIIETISFKFAPGNEMPVLDRTRMMLRLALVVTALTAVFAGCKKEDTGVDSKSTIVSLIGADVSDNGAISDAGMAKIQAQAKAPSLTVSFVRTPISDAALIQLAQFPNLRYVQAVGSPLTQAGIDKLKASIPEVQVSK